MYQRITTDLLEPNTGQIKGLPRNPRKWADEDLQDLATSLRETPELYEARPLLVIPNDGKYVVLGGNMRLAATVLNGDADAPCWVYGEDTPVEKLKEIVVKDNASFGEWDTAAWARDWSWVDTKKWHVPDFGAVENEPAGESAGGKQKLSEEELQELIDKASAGTIVDYNEDTNYDLSKLYRPQADHGEALLAEALKKKAIRPEIAQLCRIRISQCTIINFDQVIKYYRSADATPEERELLKRLYLVFITPREAVEAGLLKMIAKTGKIFEQEIAAGGQVIEGTDDEEMED